MGLEPSILKYLILFSFIPLILVGFTLVMPANATQEIDNIQDDIQDNFGEQTHLECMRSVPSYGEITFVERKFALEACREKRPDPYIANTDKFAGFAEKILEFCENYHPMYIFFNDEILFQAVVKRPMTRTCVLLYDNPLWNYTGPDRAAVLLGHLHDQTLQQLEETKDEREKSKADARLRQGQIMFIVDLFQKQNEKLEFLEKQLEEKAELITKNELLIQEQQEMIENLNQRIKNIALSSDDFQSLFDNKKLLECLKNADIKLLPINEKIKVLQECTKIDNHKLIVIDDDLITRVTETILDFCEDSYPIYLEFGGHIYYKSAQHAFAEECIWIYQQPLWSYQGPDRIEVLIEAGKPNVEQYLNEKIAERQKSVYNAHLDSGRFMVMTDLYYYVERKISYLEYQISEKNELISQQQQIIQEQMKSINEFYEELSNSSRHT